MAWPPPNSGMGMWGPGSGMPPDMMNNMCSPEQWAMMQQQNWQQWNQWQQQYAQWHNQFGEQYAQQMQGMPMGPPPPPSSAAPPLPPPPDKPPPPPHENDEPLYAKNKTNDQNSHNVQTQNSWNNSTSQQSANSVNSEALKKLAEEERLFDIQFQKWEEEIEKWRSENMNHPDKEAYREHEQKFVSCRAQLLERRQQMQQKRSRLMGNTPISNNVPAPAKQTYTTVNNEKTISAPPQTHNQNYSNEYNYTNMDNSQDNYGRGNNNMPRGQETYSMDDSQHNSNSYNESNFLTSTDYNKGGMPSGDFAANKDIDEIVPSHFLGSKDNNKGASGNFLASKDNKGIPGLDLVPEADKLLRSDKHVDVIDITDEPQENNQLKKPPDFTALTQGINSILGDEKIMNMLSMVRDNVAPKQGNQERNQGNRFNMAQNQYGQGNMFRQNIGNNNFDQQNQWGGYNNSYDNQGNNFQQNVDQNAMRYQNDHYGRNDGQYKRNDYEYDGNDDNNYNNAQYDRNNSQQNGSDFHQNNRNNSQFNMIDTQYNRGPGYEDDMGQCPTDFPNRQMRQNIPPLLANVNNPNDWRNPPQQQEDYSRRDPSMRQPSKHLTLPPNIPQKPVYEEDPIFNPSIIVDYEHSSIRHNAELKEFVHTFDYNHKSKEDEYKPISFTEVSKLESLAQRRDAARRNDYEKNERGGPNRGRDSRDHDRLRGTERESSREDRRGPRDDARDDRRRGDDRRRHDDNYRRADEGRRRDDGYYDRRRTDDRNDSRRREDRDRSSRHEDSRDRSRYVYDKREDLRNEKSNRDSGERDTRKRGHSKESVVSDSSKRSKGGAPDVGHVVMIDDLLESPGREMRPEKILIILRGIPGSGKSYLAKLIRDREVEQGGSVRILSIDDLFMQETEVEEKDPATGKMMKKQIMKYVYEESLEENYLENLKRATKRTISEGYFNFLIVDAVNDQLRHYGELWNIARQHNFQVYICTMVTDPQTAFKRNIHGRSLDDIKVISSRFFPTPAHHITLDATTLLQTAAIELVDMEDVDSEDDDVIMEDVQEWQESSSFGSKWERMDDVSQLARLDGTSKPLRPSSLSMEDYLQLDDWQPNKAKPGKKTVRWADIEERREQEKIRAIGFVVGQTDWNRMTDPTMGSSALTQTKYIERVRRN